jgi:cytochrome c
MNYSHTFEEPGVYKVSLVVRDDSGEESVAIKEIMVGNEMPELELALTAGNKSFYYPGSATRLSYDVKVSDKEDGSLEEGSIDPSRVVVSVNYLPEGQDMVQAFMDHKSLADASLQGIGKTLIEGSDCLACHKEEDKSIGPSFKDIARKYRRDKDASDYLIGKIINGGSGVWGETAMAAHPGLTPAEAGQMVSYLRSFARRGPKASALPPAGTTTLNDHMEKQGGTYIVSASYTDNGGEKVGSLTAMETLFLRHPKVQAETYDEGQAMKIPLKAGDVPGIEEDMTIVVGSEGAYLKFNELDLTGVTQLKMQIGLAATFTKGGHIEIRSDALDGEMIGKVILEQDLTTFGFWTEEVEISPTKGVHDLYFVFIGEDKADDKPVGVMDWIEFVIKNPS